MQDESIRMRPVAALLRVAMIGAVLAFFIVMFVQLFAFAEPYVFPLHMLRGRAEHVSENIVIGPYPHAQELARLKRRLGVVEVISLMNASRGIERGLVDRERMDARRLGIIFKSRPMSFLSLNNEYNRVLADKVARYAVSKYGRGTKGKLYINCYLGRHRIGLVKREIERRLASGRDDRSVAR